MRLLLAAPCVHLTQIFQGNLPAHGPISLPNDLKQEGAAAHFGPCLAHEPILPGHLSQHVAQFFIALIGREVQLVETHVSMCLYLSETACDRARLPKLVSLLPLSFMQRWKTFGILVTTVFRFFTSSMGDVVQKHMLPIYGFIYNAMAV